MFLYLLPEVSATAFAEQSSQLLLQFGLDHLIGEGVDATVSEFGGQGKIPPGLLLIPRPAWKDDSGVTLPRKDFTPPSVDGKAQSWSIGNSQGVWIGVDPRRAPEPVDLLRSKHVGGVPIPDASGKRWLVPIARASGKTASTLPTNYDFDFAGQAVAKPKPDFDHLWDISEEVFDMLEGDADLDNTRLATLLVTVLAVNYRVSPMEFSVLLNAAGRPVFDDAFIASAGMIFINSDLLRQAAAAAEDAKKNGSASDPPSGTNSTNGAAHHTPAADTDHAEPRSSLPA